MKVFGITGGVGAGKSSVLDCLKELCNCLVLRTDELAKSLEKRGEACFEPLVDLLGEQILGEDFEIDFPKMAAVIFSKGNDELLTKVNNIIHPIVKNRILEMIKFEKERGEYDFFFIEAALLIEEHYDLICDELWYIYADENVRRDRLKESRGYSDDKITNIINNQLDDSVFRTKCERVIDNSGDIDKTKDQIVDILSKVRN